MINRCTSMGTVEERASFTDRIIAVVYTLYCIGIIDECEINDYIDKLCEEYKK